MHFPLPHWNGRIGAQATILATVLVVVTVAAVVPMTATANGASSPGSSDGAVTVDLAADGAATVTVTYAFDLTTEEQREAFETLRDDEAARTETRERFAARLATVAADAAAETDREMSVSAATIDVTATDGVGLVHLSVEWSNLAAVENGRLIVSEPFASGFESDRPVTVHVPEGYAIEHATPAPDDESRTHAAWSAGTAFDGFELVAVAEERAGDGAAGGADEDQPGFGALAALVAIGTALVVCRQ